MLRLDRYRRRSLTSAHIIAARRRKGDNTAMATVRWTEIYPALGDAKADHCYHQQMDNVMEKSSLHRSRIKVNRNESHKTVLHRGTYSQEYFTLAAAVIALSV
jgi:hypothetical protein